MFFTDKQLEYRRSATKRYNVKTGATQSGKTYGDFFIIPKRIRACTGDGLIVLMGNTQATFVRNVLDPMRVIYGSTLVPETIGGDNTIMLFGKKSYIIGADKKTQVNKVRGSSIEYLYADEIATFSPEMLPMIETRLSKPGACMDATCNPENPKHPFKLWLDHQETTRNIYQQHYTLYDNPTLDADYVSALEQSFAGTVYEERYIWGRWVRAEGIIYQKFSDNPERYVEDDLPEFQYKIIGVDWGGNKSGHSFTYTGITKDWRVHVLKSSKHDAAGTSPDDIYKLYRDFEEEVVRKYGEPDGIYPDSASSSLNNGLSSHTEYPVYPSYKPEINDRIHKTNILIGGDKFRMTSDCESLKQALCDAVWDEKSQVDKRLDDGTSDIDSLDSFEYSWSYYIGYL